MTTVSVSPNGKNTYETTTPAERILVATADGIFTLNRSGAGAPWREAGRMLPGKHVNSIMVTPGGALFAGTHGDGLWASEDDGASWERRDDGIASPDFYALNCVQVGNETRLYAGTEPAELYVSNDLGHHWTHLPALRDVPSVNDWTFPGPPHIGHVKTIALDPRDPDTMYVGVEVGGAFKSTDGGKTFRQLEGFYVDVHRLMVAPSRPDDVYMATGRGLYHSADGGNSWEELRLPGVEKDGYHSRNEGISYPDGLVMLPQKPDVMFTSGASASPGAWRKIDGAFPRIGRSRDAGRTWEYLEGGLPIGTRANFEAMTLNTYPGGFALIAGTTDGDVFFSDDEGEHWSMLCEELPPVSKGGHYRALRDWTPAHA